MLTGPLVPWVVWGFFKLITPFIDPLTREKLKFNEDMRQYVPEEQLWTEFNGTLNFEYDHSVYWPALQKLSNERREEQRLRWVAGGKLIGETEDYLCGHSPVGVAGVPPSNGEDKAGVSEATTEVPAATEKAPAATEEAADDKKTEEAAAVSA